MTLIPTGAALLEALLDAARFLHQMRLLWLLHAGRQVMHQGVYRFVHTVTAQQAGGRVAMTVYFTGDPTPVDAEQIELKTSERDGNGQQ